MKSRLLSLLVISFVCLWGAVGLMTAAAADEVPRMTKEKLKEKLADEDTVILDVRSGGSWTGSAAKIQGAVREDPDAVQNWFQKYPKGKTIVLYCA